MCPMVPPPSPVPQSVSPDNGRVGLAKANARIPDIDWLVAIGAAIQAAVHDARWSNKEAAGHLAVDDAEFGKWLNGTRRPHFDKIFALRQLRVPLIVALARLDTDRVETTTVITVKRVA